MLQRQPVGFTAALALAVLLLSSRAFAQNASMPPTGGGGTCTIYNVTDNSSGYVYDAVQQSRDSGIYTCTSGNTYVPEALIVGSVDQTDSAVSCTTTNAGMIEYTGGAFYGCNGTSFGSLGGGGSSALSGITAATTTALIDSTTNGITWAWNSLSTGTGMTFSTSHALTGGTLLSLQATAASSTSTGYVLSLSDATTGAGYGGYFTMTGSGNTGYAGYFANTGTSNSGYGLYAINSQGSGLWSSAAIRADSASAIAVYGNNTNGGGIGIYGFSGGTGYSGYFSNNSASTGYGVYSTASSGSNTSYAGYFTNSDTGHASYGVYGTDASGSGYGGYFTNTSTGWALNATGTSYFNGSVGIGTTSPLVALDVNGSIRTGSNLYFTTGAPLSMWITATTPNFLSDAEAIQFYAGSDDWMELGNFGNFIWNGNGSGAKTFTLRPSNGQTSNVFIVQQNPNQGTGVLAAINGNGGATFASSVGIGTTSPVATLDVNGDVHLASTTSSGANILWNNSGTLTWGSTALTVGGSVTASGATGYLPYFTSGTTLGDSLVYETSGDVGIGTTGPTDVLDVNGAIGLTTTTATLPTNGIYSPSANSLSLTAGGAQAFTISSNSGVTDNVFQFGPSIAYNVVLYSSFGSAFLDTYNGGGGTPFEINANSEANLYLVPRGGYATIGTTSPVGLLTVNGDIDLAALSYINFGSTDGSSGYGFRDSGGTMQRKNSGGSWATISTSSDRRLKRDIVDLPKGDGLAAIMKLRPVRFHWKDVEQDKTEGEQIGLIAQDVEKAYPTGGVIYNYGNVTMTLPDGKNETVEHARGMNYERLVAPLIKAVQEQETEIEELRGEVAALKARVGQN